MRLTKLTARTRLDDYESISASRADTVAETTGVSIEQGLADDQKLLFGGVVSLHPSISVVAWSALPLRHLRGARDFGVIHLGCIRC